MELTFKYNPNKEKMAQKIIEEHGGDAKEYFKELFKSKQQKRVEDIIFNENEVNEILNEYRFDFHRTPKKFITEDWELVRDHFDFEVIDKIAPFCGKFSPKPEIESVYIGNGYIYGTDTRVLIRKEIDSKLNVHIPYFFISYIKKEGVRFMVENKQLFIYMNDNKDIRTNWNVMTPDYEKILNITKDYTSYRSKRATFVKVHDESMFGIKIDDRVALIEPEYYNKIKDIEFDEIHFLDVEKPVHLTNKDTHVVFMPYIYSSKSFRESTVRAMAEV